MRVTQSCLTLCDPMDCTWNSPGQNTGVGSLSFLQGIFLTQGSNTGLLHCRRILQQLIHREAREQRSGEPICWKEQHWPLRREEPLCVPGFPAGAWRASPRRSWCPGVTSSPQCLWRAWGCGGRAVSAGGDAHSTPGEPGTGGGWAPLGCPLKLPVSLCGYLPGRGSQASADTLTGGWMSAWEGLLPSFHPRGGGGSGCISPQGRTGCQLEDRWWALTGACWRFPSAQFLLLPPPCPTRPVACL